MRFRIAEYRKIRGAWHLRGYFNPGENIGDAPVLNANSFPATDPIDALRMTYYREDWIFHPNENLDTAFKTRFEPRENEKVYTIRGVEDFYFVTASWQ